MCTFEPVLGLPASVMSLLVADVCNHPGQIFGAEADDAVAVLPTQHPAITDLVVNVVGGRSLQLPDPLGNDHGWWDADGHMNVVCGPADFMHDDSRRLQSTMSEVTVRSALDGIDEYRGVVFRVPLLLSSVLHRPLLKSTGTLAHVRRPERIKAKKS